MANELHTMPLKVERLLSSANVQSLELDEFGAYMKLLCHAWLNKGVLPEFCLSSAKATSKLLGCEMEDIPRIKEKVIDSFFVLGEDGKARNETLSKIYSDVSIYSNERKSSGRKGGTSRANNEKQLKLSLSSGQAKLKDSLSIQSQSQSINTPLPPNGGTSDAMSTSIEREKHSRADAQDFGDDNEDCSKTMEKRVPFFQRVTWCEDSEDYIVPDEVKADWRQSFPACDIELEICGAAQWQRSNKHKMKKNHYRFITNWLLRRQENGGSRR